MNGGSRGHHSGRWVGGTPEMGDGFISDASGGTSAKRLSPHTSLNVSFSWLPRRRRPPSITVLDHHRSCLSPSSVTRLEPPSSRTVTSDVVFFVPGMLLRFLRCQVQSAQKDNHINRPLVGGFSG